MTEHIAAATLDAIRLIATKREEVYYSDQMACDILASAISHLRRQYRQWVVGHE